MRQNNQFLLEIGMEELPARFVTPSIQQLKERMEEWLQDKDIPYESVDVFSTPRRLAVRVNGLADQQRDKIEEARGPAKKIAQDENGEWTKAAIGFAKGKGVDTNDLYFKKEKNTEYVYARIEEKGKQTKELLKDVSYIVKDMNFPKNMRWGSFDLKYARPIHWIIALWNEEVIPFEITDVKTSQVSQGHRFLGSQITISHPQEYEEKLRNQFVIASAEERKEMIVSQLKELEEKQGWNIPIDEDLLEEVNQLVEYPTALFGQFESTFLSLPEDVLITSMREHQRYFPVKDKDGKLLPYFITMRNGNDDHLDIVQKGNEKVLRARLADAMFFFEEDQKLQVQDAVKKLDAIVFHEELGTIGDKVRRLEQIVTTFGEKFSLNKTDQHHLKRAAQLSKFDLVTLMVDEFPELQGKMGETYALLAGENEAVARAIKEHYEPKFSGDLVPESQIGALLSIADKLDTISACFGIGLIPTGSGDPYGLRRQAFGVAQILLDHELPLHLDECFDMVLNILQDANILQRDKEETKKEMLSFFRVRLKNIFDEKGIRYDIAEAVLETMDHPVLILLKKAEFLQQKVADIDFKATVEALSRVTNIAAKQEKEQDVQPDLFQQSVEQELYDQYKKLVTELPEQLEVGNVEEAYRLFTEINPLIHRYFDEVMVMVDDEAIKGNRLALMNRLSEVIQQFAHFQHIVFSS